MRVRRWRGAPQSVLLSHEGPIEKVRAFYASEGVTLGPIPIGKSQNEVGDGLYDLEEAARLQLGRDDLGSLFAGPVELWKPKSSADEPTYFNTVVVISGKSASKLQGVPTANTARPCSRMRHSRNSCSRRNSRS